MECSQEFALLRDFYKDSMGASGAMLWRAGCADLIWTDWIAAGRPLVNGGDGAWINEVMPDAPKLQDLLPGRFCLV
jgi:hypothetical protein